MPDNVSSLGGWAFASNPALAEVNGKNSLAAVLDDWKHAGANTTTFVNTALLDDVAEVTSETILVYDDCGRKFELKTTPGAGDDPLYTGQSATTSLTADQGDGDSSRVIRVYFQFLDSYGSINYTPGSYTFDGIGINVVKSSVPNVYYVEIPPMKAGETLNFDIASSYQNIYSGGGPANVWVSVLTQEEADALGNAPTIPAIVQQPRWTTKADTFPITKKCKSSTISVKGDGSANGLLSPGNLLYSISMSRSETTLNYGKDYMTSVDFVDTPELPEDFSWREDFLQAIRDGNWRLEKNSTYKDYYKEAHLWVTLGDDEIEFAAITQSAYIGNARPAFDEEGNFQLCWTYYNLYSNTTEIANYNSSVTIAGSTIAADEAALKTAVEAEGKTIKRTLTNNAAATQHFRYSEDQYQEASVTADISIGAANFALSKSLYSGGQRPNMGDATVFLITLENSGALPYTLLDHLEDPVNDYFYLKPEDMETMFFDDTYGKDLNITIQHATLCEPGSHTVIGAGGESHEVGRQYEGIETPHSGKALTDMVSDSDATLTITRLTDETGLRLSYGGGEFLVERGYLAEAMEDLGFVVTKPTTYTVTWDLDGQSLYSGQKRYYYVRTTLKDTFMRLIGDQDWFITSDTYYGSTNNIAHIYYHLDAGLGEKTANINGSWLYIYRDFTLNKEAYRDGTLLTDNEAVVEGDVLSYETVVTHAGAGGYEALPLVDRMQGGQVLLVSVEDNTALAGENLETVDYGGKIYYLLKRPGTYSQINVGGHLADQVVVTASSAGLDTMIYWYLTTINGKVTETVSYYALVSPTAAGLDVDSATYSLSNEIWLNDHQTHRLYDRAFVRGSILKMNKYIVTNAEEDISSGHDVNSDALDEYSYLKRGEKVTYRLMLEGLGESAVTVGGNAIYDALPPSIDNYWNKENVSIRYIRDGTIMISDETDTAWRIETDGNDANQQYIRWNEDFSVTLKGTLYIYVTLTFPDEEAWDGYAHRYAGKELRNTFHVYQLYDEVSHELSVPGKLMLQKGVLQTGMESQFSYIGGTSDSRYISIIGEDTLKYYTNDAKDYGIVTYYIALYNGGETRVYLSPIQDVLPKGFSFRGLSTNESFSLSSSSIVYERSVSSFNSLLLLKNESGVPKFEISATVSASTTQNEDGHEVVTFNISKGNGTLSYDEKCGKYYLQSGQAVVFCYHCRTNRYEDTEDAANNLVSMPYYDYNGSGVTLDTQSKVGINTSHSKYKENYGAEGKISNDGNRYVMTNGQAALVGMNTEGYDDATQWLASDVTVYRGQIQPGITKLTESPFAHVQDTIEWNVVVTNSGTEAMRDYTLADTMMSPYQFTGAVRYSIAYDNLPDTYYTQAAPLFTIGERMPGDETVKIDLRNGSQQTLTVNGDPLELSCYFYKFAYTNTNNTYYTSAYVPVLISLSRDEDGNETMKISFKDDVDAVTGLPTGTHATLTVHTKNFSGSYSNATYVNAAYLTPSDEQTFDHGAVNQGNYTLYDDLPSVTSEANVSVSYGYATTSEKTVTEIANSDNNASSSSSTNYIVLGNGSRDVQYGLTVNNTGGSSVSKAMKQLVMIDNLPQPGDHATFYEEIPRYSNFKMCFAADPAFSVQINDSNLAREAYRLQLTEKTKFSAADWNGTNNEGWYSLAEIEANGELMLEDMRSFRVVIEDNTGTVIPANAVIKLGFDAHIHGEPGQALTAWNSFGYHYSLLGESAELEAAPQKVGVKTASSPSLVKKLIDTNGTASPAEEDLNFRFLIYKGNALSLANGYTEEEVLSALSGREYTFVELSVAEGESSSEVKNLVELVRYTYTEGELQATEIPWTWSNLERYTLLELPVGSGSRYSFGAINSTQPNNYSFRYNSASPLTLVCSNVKKSWELQAFKQGATDHAYLSGAVFGLYSAKQTDWMPMELYETLAVSAPKTVNTGGMTWYLKDVQTTNANGAIRWKDLTEQSYYLLELQAPNGYKLNDTPGQVISEPVVDGTAATVTVTNEAVKNLTISKTVAGSMGSRDQYFKFTLTISNAASGSKYTVDLSHADSIVGSNTATRNDYKGKRNPTVLTVGSDGKLTSNFYLQHGQTITIQGLTEGTTYSIAEEAEDYISAVTNNNEKGTIASKDVTVAFVNTRDMCVPTGANHIPYTALALFAFVPGIIIWRRRRKIKLELKK